jgi:chloramphenicol-sensitive protein RarD
MGESIDTEHRQTSHGLVFGVGAYGLWGLIPLYFKAVADIAPLEVLAHRGFWSFVVLGLILGATHRGKELAMLRESPRVILMLLASTLLIAINWLTFIYAVGTGQVLQSSLGYFILPLVNVLLGVVFLRERLRPYQWLSILLALVGVIVLGVMVNRIPWIALGLAVSFSVYGFLRKVMPVGGLVGLAIETLALTPVALAYLVYLQQTGQSTATNPTDYGVLALSGLVTTIPLLLFIAAARRLQLTTLGFLQYLTPTLQFLLAVVAFGEPFSRVQLLSFGCIWTAVFLYSLDSFRAARRRELELVEPD